MRQKVNNVLVIGANGTLGMKFREYAPSNYQFAVRDYKDRKTDNDIEFDLSCHTGDDYEYWVTILKSFDVVINCAAVTNVDKIEDSKRNDTEYFNNAIKTNTIGVELLAKACAETDTVLFHISTNYVFDGNTNQPYIEESTCNPLNEYGLQKMRAEEAIRKSGCRYFIIRTSWLYSEIGNNLFTRCRQTLDDANDIFNEVSAANDIISSPTYAGDLVDAIHAIIEYNRFEDYGTYHYTNEGVCTRYDFLKALQNMFNYDGAMLKPVSGKTFSNCAKRPYVSVLSKQKFNNIFKGLHQTRHWYDALRSCYIAYEDMVQKMIDNTPLD